MMMLIYFIYILNKTISMSEISSSIEFPYDRRSELKDLRFLF